MQRRNIIVLMISLSLVLLLGSSYALLRSTAVGSNPYVINVGTLQVTFEDNQTEKLNLENMYPMSDKEGMSQSKVLGFVIKNTGTVGSYYDITLEETSTNPEFKSVIRFISNKDSQGYNEPKTLGEDKYIEVGGYLKNKESSSYKVKIWLDYDADNTYMNKEFKAKVVVNSFQESNYAKDVIKNKLVKYSESSKDDFTGGLVAVNTDGDLYNETIETQEIREYRYSGPSVNNYVTFNNELWRIVGVFKDVAGAEHLKIVRNEVIKQIDFPATFEANNIVYNIKSTNTNGDYVFWNNKVSGTNNNDWATAGIQYWLNAGYDVESKTPSAGYMSYLSKNAKDMVEETKYYLGTVTFYGATMNDGSDSLYGIKDTVNETYKNERTITGCEGGRGPIENNSYSAVQDNPTCRVWSNNQATWEGKIGLIYPSDYGYSANSQFWNTKLGAGTFNRTASDSSWLLKTGNHTSVEWLVSPSSRNTNIVASWSGAGSVNDTDMTYDIVGIRPTLYLKGNVKITSGYGTFEIPYQLEI